MVMIQRILNGVCAPFVVMGMVFGIFGFMFPERKGDILKTVREEVAGFFHAIGFILEVVKIAFFVLVGLAFYKLVFPEEEE